MFVISFFHESLGEWTGTGTGAFDTREEARTRMRELADECHHCVSFKLVKLPD